MNLTGHSVTGLHDVMTQEKQAAVATPQASVRAALYLQVGTRPLGWRRLRTRVLLWFFGQVLQHDAPLDWKPSTNTHRHTHTAFNSIKTYNLSVCRFPLLNVCVCVCLSAQAAYLSLHFCSASSARSFRLISLSPR